MSATFTELLTEAHRKGDETELNRLLDVQSATKDEIAWRVEQANSAAAAYEHQLHALANLLDGAADQGMDVSDGQAPRLTGWAVATRASQEWADRSSR